MANGDNFFIEIGINGFVHTTNFQESEDQTAEQFMQTNFWDLKGQAYPASLQSFTDTGNNKVMLDCRSIMWCRINPTQQPL